MRKWKIKHPLTDKQKMLLYILGSSVLKECMSSVLYLNKGVIFCTGLHLGCTDSFSNLIKDWPEISFEKGVEILQKQTKNRSEMTYTLAPSNIQGVGVFTMISIKNGEHLDLFDPEDCRYIALAKEGEQDFLDKYAIPEYRQRGWWAPLDWKRMSLGWYLNHSEEPNLHPDRDCNEYYASRDILPGEELTINYNIFYEYE